jgi:GLPGLI family protein
MKYLLAAVPLLLILTTCKKGAYEEKYNSGLIEYKINYLENEMTQISPTLLPKKMKLEFNPDYSINTIEGFMGFFKLSNHTNFKHKKCTTLLEVLNKKYLFKGRKGESMCCFDENPDMEIEYTDEVKEIAGLSCKKAIVTLPGQNDKFSIYYTDEISISKPNSTNPYNQIDGVLMEFQLKLAYLKMQFTADKFVQGQNNKTREFKVPENCLEVNREQMTYIIQRLME